MHLYARDYGGATSKYERELMKVNVDMGFMRGNRFSFEQRNWKGTNEEEREREGGDYDVDE